MYKEIICNNYQKYQNNTSNRCFLIELLKTKVTRNEE